jgi:hypothetical protein
MERHRLPAGNSTLPKDKKRAASGCSFFLDGEGAVYAGDFSAGLDVRAYFWRKRSTRPAVSTIFCLPV